jgi:hypothetical protein
MASRAMGDATEKITAPFTDLKSKILNTDQENALATVKCSWAIQLR